MSAATDSATNTKLKNVQSANKMFAHPAARNVQFAKRHTAQTTQKSVIHAAFQHALTVLQSLVS